MLEHNVELFLAYALNKNKKISEDFYMYYFQWHYLQEIFFPFGQGVSPEHRWTLKDSILMNFPIVYPPYEEQVKMAKLLKQKLSMIDDLSKILPKEILRECIASIIYSIITGKTKE